MKNNCLENFIPKEMPKLYEQDGFGEKTKVYLKLEAINGWIWYLTEFDQDNTFFGYVHGWCDEWGYVSLDEINELYKDNLIWVCEDFKPINLNIAVKGV